MPQVPPLFDLISARSTWLGQRQAVLGQNVAHADTPGYLPRDLEPLGFDGLLARRRAPRGRAHGSQPHGGDAGRGRRSIATASTRRSP